ncbi:Phosphatidylinositol 4-kinase gamma 2 [Hibiscus syriacus]|uniref:1-phosphatidylinositol 4-kinase n=1 Tax=Hibiscus syriacus TaxID=106335 RepID=A0A6A2YWZ3_HIBSY|nr:Phosphatidylinositol 4-kinase gamma 2 [Hibiscus syriacus]
MKIAVILISSEIFIAAVKSAKVQAKHVEKDLEISVVTESEIVFLYFMQDKSGLHYVSIFKPIDEEPLAVNNPQGLPPSTNGEGLKRGTRVGEGAVREVAAYLLDHPKKGPRSSSGDELIGFAGVPPTCMVQCLHKGFNHPDGKDMGPASFPVEEVHKISVFDIRMANADRHAGNILFRKGDDGRTVLIPIDHGYCLPENFEDCIFDWVYWTQLRKPYSADTINYIKSLDAEQDITLLKYYGVCSHTADLHNASEKRG